MMMRLFVGVTFAALPAWALYFLTLLCAMGKLHVCKYL